MIKLVKTKSSPPRCCVRSHQSGGLCRPGFVDAKFGTCRRLRTEMRRVDGDNYNTTPANLIRWCRQRQATFRWVGEHEIVITLSGKQWSFVTRGFMQGSSLREDLTDAEERGREQTREIENTVADARRHYRS